MVVYSSLTLGLFFFYISKYLLSDNIILHTIGLVLYMGGFILIIVFGAMSNFKYKPFRGELLGLLYFYNDRIEYEDEIYKINDIKSLEVHVKDYSGRVESGRDCNWKISNGTGNAIVLITENTKKITYNFQILNEGDIFKIKDQLIHYHLAGKISWLHLIDILCINDYDDIQEFKKVVANIKENYAIPPRN